MASTSMTKMSSNTTPAPAATTTTSSTPSRVLKRKSITEDDMFKPCKRAKDTRNASSFALEHQRASQKVQEQLPIREDILTGIIVPHKFVPKDVHTSRKGRSTSDVTRTYRWAQLHGDKAHVRKNQHLSQKAKDRATQSFPRLEAKKKQEKEAQYLQDAGWRKERDEMVEWWHNEVKEEKELKLDDNEPLRKAEFMYQCWKNFNYAASYKSGQFEHRDLNKWDKEFSDKWTEKKSKVWWPEWEKDRAKGCLVMKWKLHRV